jgi:hypothetical protein
MRAVVLICILLVTGGATDAGLRRQCREACAERVATCFTAGVKPRRCERLLLKRCLRHGVAACVVAATTTTTSTVTTTSGLALSTTTEENSSSTTTTTGTTLIPGSRTDVFNVVDDQGNVAEITVQVDMSVPIIRFTEAVEVGEFLSCQVSGFKQAQGIHDLSWSVGLSGNVIRVAGNYVCGCGFSVHCTAGQTWYIAYGPPWPIQESLYFDPTQPFIIVWQGTSLYVN